MVKRSALYRFPWSQVDNPGAWIEVTDSCDLACPGCFRHPLEGHRGLDVIKEEIMLCQRETNCERIAIAGGEPLLYPHLPDVVEFISRQKIKAVLMTNGEQLTRERALDLKKAGLVQFYFHVDSGQQRPGWERKNECEMNDLRQYYADLVAGLKNVQCGFNITITRANLYSIPEIISWGIANIDKVQSLSLIAFRGFLTSEGMEYLSEERKVKLRDFQCVAETASEIDITSDEMFELLRFSRPELQPCAYLNGTADASSNKFLVILPIGSRGEVYGVLGAKAIELFQILQHVFTGKYTSLVRTLRPSKSVFVTSLFDQEARKAFRRFLRTTFRRPSRLVRKIHLQCLNLVQPTEIIGEEKNFCDGCINLIPWKGKMVHSCVLDEYRIFGGPIRPVRREDPSLSGRTAS